MSIEANKVYRDNKGRYSLLEKPMKQYPPRSWKDGKFVPGHNHLLSDMTIYEIDDRTEAYKLELERRGYE